MSECHCSKNNKGQIDHSNHLPIGIFKLSGSTKVGAVDELHYFRSS
jgi:hypothetical protein